MKIVIDILNISGSHFQFDWSSLNQFCFHARDLGSDNLTKRKIFLVLQPTLNPQC